MPATARFPRVSGSSQRKGELGLWCNPLLAWLPRLPWSLKNTASDVPEGGCQRFVGSPVGIPYPTCDPLRPTPIRSRRRATPNLVSSNPRDGRESPRRGAPLVESLRAVVL